ncbi:fatty acyl-CoA reductase 3-like isoform X2 [Cucumis melo var. makuwa]|uniref:Fatty acyl-CoA reductase 3-like isoform X2 n=1 Tax=Cucumis melo var. makuwa TaxID=1194695 RepID=A0A5A7U9Z5_CUCMM|nr:fatty acyl-CoA reductase 3-like isoform X2 [Cucumis melo var. makuwa]TYK00673.1 fatty acyl-CoA reductase 3-like isoform X2 [Cucumis melo var. makuwa]
MVVNAMLVAMVAHASQPSSYAIYHVSSSMRNPVMYGKLQEYGFHYFSANPWINKDGQPVRVGKVTILKDMASFHRYMTIRKGLTDMERVSINSGRPPAYHLPLPLPLPEKCDMERALSRTRATCAPVGTKSGLWCLEGAPRTYWSIANPKETLRQSGFEDLVESLESYLYPCQTGGGKRTEKARWLQNGLAAQLEGRRCDAARFGGRRGSARVQARLGSGATAVWVRLGWKEGDAARLGLWFDAARLAVQKRVARIAGRRCDWVGFTRERGAVHGFLDLGGWRRGSDDQLARDDRLDWRRRQRRPTELHGGGV